MPRWAGTTTQRGLGAEHQALRKHKLAVLVDGTPCRRCGHPMYHPTRCRYCNRRGCFFCTLDLGHPDDAPRVLTQGGADHTRPSVGGRELEHRHCNRSAGTRLGNALRTRASRTQGRTRRRQHTRDW
jgi:hypothetical protein